MSTKRFKLTAPAKILVLLLVTSILGGSVYCAISNGLIKMPEKDNMTINISLDEWIGWKTIIDANGGLTTQDGSIFDELGITVNINVINDATQSSTAMIKGDLDGAGYTVNRMAFLSNKFSEAEFDVVCPYITNYSNGGDGIIATDAIQSIDDLVGAKIGVPEYSEAQSMVIWFVNQSDLSDEDKADIIDNLILFETADECATAFFAGQIDVSATWEPYLTQASQTEGAHVLFDTSSSTKLVMDGILFSKEFVDENQELVSLFIDGCLQASDLYDTEFDYVKDTMPMFEGMTDEEIYDMTTTATLTTWKDNMNLLSSGARTVFTSMCEVWESIGETVDEDLVYTLFDTTCMSSLTSKYKSDSTQSTETKLVTSSNKSTILSESALLAKSASITFVSKTADFEDESEVDEVLAEFLDIANTLDKVAIVIEGNIDSRTNSETSPLSTSRAEAVAQWFIDNGIDEDRIIYVGNGSSNPVVENPTTEEERAMNRRTDISFKIVSDEE